MNPPALFAGVGIAILSTFGIRFGGVKVAGISGSLAAVLIVIGILF